MKKKKILPISDFEKSIDAEIELVMFQARRGIELAYQMPIGSMDKKKKRTSQHERVRILESVFGAAQAVHHARDGFERAGLWVRLNALLESSKNMATKPERQGAYGGAIELSLKDFHAKIRSNEAKRKIK